ncbi:MAG: hypothetical protein IPM17_12800 [Verrucomicrobia bacterium]|nr:hypothetical protein [Verrucomicrobiota bacterium]
MNRAVLVVLVDFLLISLVTLFSSNRMSDRPQSGGGEGGTDVEVQAVQDMLDTLKQALELEQATRQQLTQNLSLSEAALAEKQQQVAAREAQLRQLEAGLQQTEQRARALEEERARLQAQQEQTQQALAALQSRESQAREAAAELQAQLDRWRNEANVSQAKVQAMEGELVSRREEARRMQEQIAALDRANREAAAAKERLAVEAGTARTEAAVVREQLAVTRTQVESLASEKSRLQETAATLAEGTREIAREVQAQRTLAPNAIYGDYISNRVQIAFSAQRPALLGLGGKKDDVDQTILFRSGDSVFALSHIAATPLPEVGGGPDWHSLTATLQRGNTRLPLSQLWLLRSDIRIVVLPIPEAAVNTISTRIYNLTAEPAKFQEAVLVGAKEGYYGEVEFRLDPALPQYVRMQTRPVGRIFGKFSPTRGDLVFTMQGDLLGIMVNNTYCLLLSSVQPARTVRLGENIADQRTGRIGGEVAARVQALPFKLQ